MTTVNFGTFVTIGRRTAKSIANLKSHSLIWVTVYAWSAKNWQRLLTWWTRKFYLRSDGLAAYYYYTCMKKQMRNIGKWNHIEHYLISRYSKFSQERFTMPNEKSSPGARTILSNLLFMMKRFSMVQNLFKHCKISTIILWFLLE